MTWRCGGCVGSAMRPRSGGFPTAEEAVEVLVVAGAFGASTRRGRGLEECLKIPNLMDLVDLARTREFLTIFGHRVRGWIGFSEGDGKKWAAKPRLFFPSRCGERDPPALSERGGPIWRLAAQCHLRTDDDGEGARGWRTWPRRPGANR